MKPNIPSPRFEENDATRLIATFGAKPCEETKEKIQGMLKDQKQQFLENNREREARTKDGRSR